MRCSLHLVEKCVELRHVGRFMRQHLWVTQEALVDPSVRETRFALAALSLHAQSFECTFKHIVPSQLSAVTSGKAQTQAYNEAVVQKCRGHGLGPTVGTQLGEMLALLSAHMEELNKLSIEEKCRVVKHCRIDKTFQPKQCRVTGSSLELLQGEIKA